MPGYILALMIILVYLAAMVLVFKLKGEKLKERGITLWGPFVMVRTEKGKKIIERLSKYERFWKAFGTFSIGIVVFFMVAMFLLLLWEATIITQIPKELAPSPQMLIGVPGINPLIPIWYGIWGLAVGILIHEFCHGILTMVGKMKVKSLGLLFFIFPMGAFVEPDEEQLKVAPRKKRMHVYAVGPGVNILFAFACAALFSYAFMGALAPASQGGPITYVLDDTPAFDGGLEKGDFITALEGVSIDNGDDFSAYMNTTRAGDTLNVTLFHKGQGSWNTTVTLGYWSNFDDVYQKDVSENTWYLNETPSLGLAVENISGQVVVGNVISDSPGDDAGVSNGDVITSIANSTFSTTSEYNSTLASLVPGNTHSIVFERNGTTINRNITVGAGKGFMGVMVTKTDLEALAADLNRPGRNTDSFNDVFVNTIRFIGMPFQRIGPEDKLQPMEGLITELYVVEGPLGALPDGAFWVMANMLYWAFWISLMVGLTNALPAVPMDGGYIFHDLMTGFASRFSKNEEKIEKAVDKMAIALALSVLFLILWQIIGPRVF